MRSDVSGRTEIMIGRGTVALRRDELDRLLEALRASELPGAASVAEEIAALRVAGVRVQLLPTRAELGALRAAISTVTARGHGIPPSFVRLAALCADG